MLYNMLGRRLPPAVPAQATIANRYREEMSEVPGIAGIVGAGRPMAAPGRPVQRSLARTESVTSVSSVTPKALANRT